MLTVFTACSSESSDDSSTTDDSSDESTSYEETSSSSGETSDVTDVIGEVIYKSSSCLVMSVYEAAGIIDNYAALDTSSLTDTETYESVNIDSGTQQVIILT